MCGRDRYVLTIVVAMLALVASIAPLVFDLYARDPAFAKGAQRGADVVTLILGAPLLLLGMTLAGRGSARGRILWIGMLEYILYDFIFYLLGAQMNELLPIYVLVCALSLYALISLMNSAELTDLGESFDAAVPARPVAAWMFFFAALLAGVWLTLWYVNLFIDPRGGMGLPSEAVHLVAAVDMTVYCPAFLVIGVLLWRRTPTGFAHASAAMAMSSLFPLTLIATAPFQARLGVPNAWATVPLWACLSLGSFICCVAMLRRVRPPRAQAAATA
jgi:hypothetical protein